MESESRLRTVNQEMKADLDSRIAELQRMSAAMNQKERELEVRPARSREIEASGEVG